MTTAWSATLDALPARHPRRCGRTLMAVGAITLAFALPISLALANLALGLLALGALLARPPLHRLPGTWFGLAFSAWLLVSMSVAWSQGGPAPGKSNLLYSWLALPLAAAAFADLRTRRQATLALSVSLTAAAVLAILQFTLGFDGDRRPLHLNLNGQRGAMVSSFLGYNLTYGIVAVLGGLALLAAPITRWTLAGRIAAGIALPLTLARLALLGALTGLGAYALAMGSRWRRWAVPGGILVTVILGGTLALLQPLKVERLLHGEDGRLHIWEVNRHIVADQPWFGTGSTTAWKQQFKDRWPALIGSRPEVTIREPTQVHAHHTWLTIAGLHGIPAAILYSLFLLALIPSVRRCWRVDRQAGAAAIGVLTAWIIAGQFNNLAGQGESAYAFAIALALTGALTAYPGTEVHGPGK